MPHFSPSTLSYPAGFLAALGLLLTAAGAAQAQTPASFGPASTYPAGIIPIGMAVGDVNGDGRPDIITVDPANDAAGVLLRLAGGGFSAASSYSAGAYSSPYGIAVADVNGDGRLDIATANYGSSTAGVLLGRIGGGFASVTTYSTGATSNPRSVAVGDVNGDGRPDIVTANGGSNTAGVLLGLASGGFASVSTYSTGTSSQPCGVAMADVNGDGRLDIVTANYTSSSAGVLLALASGGFGPVSTYSTGSFPSGVAVGDVNGDGRPDIVTANTGSNTAGV
ncbi:FG-GAP repeat domain-containing protein, partial [Hymenobacter convexus]|uniref:FG-GAP repeat domain-containing protein n=1 Tax=Hymenobacter sp. CA1UV-4 TaxID=3063782 RepID=UPI0027135BEB